MTLIYIAAVIAVVVIVGGLVKLAMDYKSAKDAAWPFPVGKP